MTNTLNIPIEVREARFPLRITSTACAAGPADRGDGSAAMDWCGSWRFSPPRARSQP